MKIAKTILAGAATLAIVTSGAFAQDMTGTVSKVDQANGKITVQTTPSGTVGANAANASEDFKVQDGLMFNAIQAGDKVAFSVSEVNGVKTITKLQKQ
jgi:Cu/Ag efflux protein CusF